MNILNDYMVYIYTNKANEKKYIGLYPMEEFKRNDINLYPDNELLLLDIKNYGWDSFSFEIVESYLNYSLAIKYVLDLIAKYDTIANGYNITNEHKNFFAHLDSYNSDYSQTNNKYFTRIPNDLIQCNPIAELGLNRIIYSVYITIDTNRTIFDKSYIVIGDLLASLGYKVSKDKPLIFNEVVKCILFLRDNKYIRTDFDFKRITYKTMIPMTINAPVFDAIDNFTPIYQKDYETILNYGKSGKDVEHLLHVYLYIASFIIFRDKNNTSSKYESEHPEAYYKSLDNLLKDTGLSKQTVIAALKYLCIADNNHKNLLVKHKVGCVRINSCTKRVPNIYVLNNYHWEKEIDLALRQLKIMYNVIEFTKETYKPNDEVNEQFHFSSTN